MRLALVLSLLAAVSVSAQSTLEKVQYFASQQGYTVASDDVLIVNGAFVSWTSTNTPPTQAELDALVITNVATWTIDTRPTRGFEQTFTNRFAVMQGYMGTNLSITIPFNYGDSLILEQELSDFVINEANASYARAVNSLATSLLFLWNRIVAIDPLAMYTPYFGE